MKGSEKKIAWAQDIEHSILRECDMNIDSAQKNRDQYHAGFFSDDVKGYQAIKAMYIEMFASEIAQDAANVIKCRDALARPSMIMDHIASVKSIQSLTIEQAISEVLYIK